MSKKTFVEGEIIVYFEDSASREDVEKIIKDLGLKLIRHYESMRGALIGCAAGGEHRAMWDLVQNKLVQSVDHSYVDMETVEPVKG